jgi:hypothetical protein
LSSSVPCLRMSNTSCQCAVSPAASNRLST